MRVSPCPGRRGRGQGKGTRAKALVGKERRAASGPHSKNGRLLLPPCFPAVNNKLSSLSGAAGSQGDCAQTSPGSCSPRPGLCRPCRRGARPQASRKPTNPKSNGNNKQATRFPLQAEAAAPPAPEPQQTGTKRRGPRGQQAPAPSARTPVLSWSRVGWGLQGFWSRRLGKGLVSHD